MNNSNYKIPNVYLNSCTAVSRLQQPQIQMYNYGGYTFNKQSAGLDSVLSGDTALNNSAVSIINAFFSKQNKNITVNNKNNSAFSNNNNSGTATSFIISKPNFSNTSSKVTIQFFYYTASNTHSFTGASTPTSFNTPFRNEISELSSALSQLFIKEVNIIATRLYYPYLNSDIFSQYLAHNASSNTFINFHEAILTNMNLNKTDLPAHVSGIKVQISGRLVTETVVPRITVKSCLIGSFKTNNATQIIDYNKYTTKNELGAFTVKVWICQQS